MCGLKEIREVDVRQSAPDHRDVSQASPKPRLSPLVSLIGWWKAIAKALSSTAKATNTMDRVKSSTSSHVSAVPSNKNTDVNALAEEKSVMTALRAVGLYLTKTGFEPGRDFSVGQDKLLLNAHAYNYLQQTMEPKHFTDIVELTPDLLVFDNRAEMNALNRHLGVDFFENLRATMLVRLPALSDTAILGYSSRLIQGFSHRHPEIKGFEHWVKQVVHEAIDTEHLRFMEHEHSVNRLQIEEEDGWVLLIDLLMAAGGTEDTHFYHTVDGVIATDEGKKLLAQLIAGPYMRVVDLA